VTGAPQVSEAFELLRQGRDAEARALLEKVVQDDNADAAVLETLGDVREKLGDKAGAIDAYLGAVTHLRVRGELQRALGVLELMLIVDEDSIDARLEAAAIREEKGDAVGAWRELAAAANAAGHATRTTDQEARKVEPAVLGMNGPVPNAAAALAVIDARALAGSLLSRRLADDARQGEERAATLESARAAESDERSPLARLLEEREDPVPKTDPGAPAFADDTAEHARDDQSDDDDTTDVER
jgi:tetratricopeptide (TPR) repeat protein